MSYYQYIDGKRYDRQLIELAKQLAPNTAEITLELARELYTSVLDGRGITPTERATIAYLLSSYPWTEEAQTWITNQPGLNLEAKPPFSEAIATILAKHDVPQLAIRAPKALIAEMNCRFPSEIPFIEALELAVYTILNDESNRNSPRAVVMDILQTYPFQFADYKEFDQIIRTDLTRRMNEGYLQLLPVWEEIPEDERDFNYPDNREASADYWIFYLGITTDDHQFWTIVDRAGEDPSYNYGYN